MAGRFNGTLESLGISLQGPVPDIYLIENNVPLSAGFVLLSSVIVLLMQLGFAQWETGLARIANTQNIFMKNMVGSAMSALVFFLVGYAFAFGEGSWANPFIGSAGFALIDVTHLYTWFIQWSFANNAATIYSGALAGRSRFMANMYCIIIITAIIYPCAAHWVWSRKGWLANMGANGAIDCSGGGPVHLLGGVFGLIGCVIIGPRVEYSRSLRARRWIGAHNKLLAAGGAFLLWMGWLAFTSVTAASADPTSQVPVAGRVLVVTLLAGAASALTTFFGRRAFNKEYDLVWVANGLMAGCASITAPASVVQPWVALIIGALASVFVHVLSEVLLWVDVDDPLDATAVHITGGLWGLLAVGLFADPVLIGQMNGVRVTDVVASGAYGVAFGGSGQQLGIQALEALAITAWTMATAIPFFLVLRSTGRLRVTRETEVGGLDLFKHGDLAYSSSGEGGSRGGASRGGSSKGGGGGDSGVTIAGSRRSWPRGADDELVFDDVDEDAAAGMVVAADGGLAGGSSSSMILDDVVIVSGVESHPGTHLDRSNPIALALGSGSSSTGRGSDTYERVRPIFHPAVPANGGGGGGCGGDPTAATDDGGHGGATTLLVSGGAVAGGSPSVSAVAPHPSAFQRALAPVWSLFGYSGGGSVAGDVGAAHGADGGTVAKRAGVPAGGRRVHDDDPAMRLAGVAGPVGASAGIDDSPSAAWSQAAHSPQAARGVGGGGRVPRSPAGSVIVTGGVKMRRYREEESSAEAIKSRVSASWRKLKRRVAWRSAAAAAAAAAASTPPPAAADASSAGAAPASTGAAAAVGGSAGGTSSSSSPRAAGDGPPDGAADGSGGINSASLRARHMLAHRNAIANARIGLDSAFIVAPAPASPQASLAQAAPAAALDAQALQQQLPPVAATAHSPRRGGHESGALARDAAGDGGDRHVPLTGRPRHPGDWRRDASDDEDDDDEDDDEEGDDERNSTAAEADQARRRRPDGGHAGMDADDDEAAAAGVDIGEDDRGLGDEVLEFGTQRADSRASHSQRWAGRSGASGGDSQASSDGGGGGGIMLGRGSGGSQFKSGRSVNSVTFHPDVRQPGGAERDTAVRPSQHHRGGRSLYGGYGDAGGFRTRTPPDAYGPGGGGGFEYRHGGGGGYGDGLSPHSPLPPPPPAGYHPRFSGGAAGGSGGVGAYYPPAPEPYAPPLLHYYPQQQQYSPMQSPQQQPQHYAYYSGPPPPSASPYQPRLLPPPPEQYHTSPHDYHGAVPHPAAPRLPVSPPPATATATTAVAGASEAPAAAAAGTSAASPIGTSPHAPTPSAGGGAAAAVSADAATGVDDADRSSASTPVTAFSRSGGAGGGAASSQHGSGIAESSGGESADWWYNTGPGRKLPRAVLVRQQLAQPRSGAAETAAGQLRPHYDHQQQRQQQPRAHSLPLPAATGPPYAGFPPPPDRHAASWRGAPAARGGSGGGYYADVAGHDFAPLPPQHGYDDGYRQYPPAPGGGGDAWLPPHARYQPAQPAHDYNGGRWDGPQPPAQGYGHYGQQWWSGGAPALPPLPPHGGGSHFYDERYQQPPPPPALSSYQQPAPPGWQPAPSGAAAAVSAVRAPVATSPSSAAPVSTPPRDSDRDGQPAAPVSDASAAAPAVAAGGAEAAPATVEQLASTAHVAAGDGAPQA